MAGNNPGKSVCFSFFSFLIMALILFSINANGLRSKEKRQSMLSWQNDILCVQETRWDDSLVEDIKKDFVGQIFSSNGTPRARGVAVLIKTDRVTGVNLVYGDKEGRVIVIDCMYETKKFKNYKYICAERRKRKENVFYEISKWWEGNCVIIGDFNVAMTPTDVSKNNVFKGDVSRGALKDLIITKQCLDIWRLLHPWERAYSRRQIAQEDLHLHRPASNPQGEV
uniref:exodeoxyribonuclease III n=1 Tax=Labrus bergylta TaxID=56723 RepID=A0A3Q3FS35_9LABR